jgi:hypothetical protein
MTTTIPAPARHLVLGAVITTLLIALGSQPVRAEKALECYNQSQSVCEKVERCTGGFEANGSCKYMLTTKYSYWRF